MPAPSTRPRPASTIKPARSRDHDLLIGVPKETFAGEKRVATVPEVVAKLIKLGFSVAVESESRRGGQLLRRRLPRCRRGGVARVGRAAGPRRHRLLVRPPTLDEVGMLREGATLIGFVWPAQHPELMAALQARKTTVLAIDCLPRQLSRAQKMDALSPWPASAGYRAVVEAANAFGRFFNGQITAAARSRRPRSSSPAPASPGLAAIGTGGQPGRGRARNDTRAEVADQVVSPGGERRQGRLRRRGLGWRRLREGDERGFRPRSARCTRARRRTPTS